MALPCLFAVAILIPSGTPALIIAVAISAAFDAAAPFSFLLCLLANWRPVFQGISAAPQNSGHQKGERQAHGDADDRPETIGLSADAGQGIQQPAHAGRPRASAAGDRMAR